MGHDGLTPRSSCDNDIRNRDNHREHTPQNSRAYRCGYQSWSHHRSRSPQKLLHKWVLISLAALCLLAGVARAMDETGEYLKYMQSPHQTCTTCNGAHEEKNPSRRKEKNVVAQASAILQLHGLV